jgi:hypothetical protein
MLNSASFDTNKPNIIKKILDPHIGLDPKKHDLFSKGHLTKKLFFTVFGTFTKN